MKIEDLAKAVREYLDLWSKGATGWGSECPLAKARVKVESMADQILNAPPQQESATVAEIRDAAENGILNNETTNKKLTRWANELAETEALAIEMTKISDGLKSKLEAAQQRITELEQQAKESEFPINFGQQCYQDRCENAYVEASVVKMLEEEVCGLKARLESRQPSQPVEVNWEAIGGIARTSWDEWAATSDIFCTTDTWVSIAKAVITAYEASRNPAQSGGTDEDNPSWTNP